MLKKIPTQKVDVGKLKLDWLKSSNMLLSMFSLRERPLSLHGVCFIALLRKGDKKEEG